MREYDRGSAPAVGKTSPGMRAATSLGCGSPEWGSAATAAIWAARFPPAEWPMKATRSRSGRTCFAPVSSTPSASRVAAIALGRKSLGSVSTSF